MRKLTYFGATFLAVAALASPATARDHPRRALVRAVAAWAAQQGGLVVGHHPWSVRPKQEIVRATIPVTLHPSGLVSEDTVTILVWRTLHWGHGFSMIQVGSRIAAPPGYGFGSISGPTVG